MVCSAVLSGRLSAASAALSQAGPEAQAAISRTQAQAVLDLLRRELPRLDADERAELNVQVARVAWAKDDLIALMQVFEHISRGSTPKAKRRDQQHWDKILNCYDRTSWELLCNSHAPANSKLDVILNQPIRLGLRLPSEPTFHSLSALWLLCANGGGADSSDRATWQKRLKLEFRRRARKSVHIADLMFSLPEPCTLDKTHPDLYAAAYERGPPLPIPMKVAKQVYELEATFQMRGGDVRESDVGLFSPSRNPKDPILLLNKTLSMIGDVMRSSPRESPAIQDETQQSPPKVESLVDFRKPRPIGRRPPQLTDVEPSEQSPHAQLTDMGPGGQPGIPSLAEIMGSQVGDLDSQPDASLEPPVQLSPAPVQINVAASPQGKGPAAQLDRTGIAEALYGAIVDRDNEKKTAKQAAAKAEKIAQAKAKAVAKAKARAEAKARDVEAKANTKAAAKAPHVAASVHEAKAKAAAKAPHVAARAHAKKGADVCAKIPAKRALIAAAVEKAKSIALAKLATPKAAPKTEEPRKKRAKPNLCNEATRSQFLVRTGWSGPGQSMAFKYTSENFLAVRAMTQARLEEQLADWISHR